MSGQHMRAGTRAGRRREWARAALLPATVITAAAAWVLVPAGAALAATPVPTAYVTNEGSGTVTPINTATNTPGTPIAVGHQPTGIAITPNGTTAYVAYQSGGTLKGMVTPINTATGTPGTPITVGNDPVAIAITPNGATAYVVNFYSGTVTPISTATAWKGKNNDEIGYKASFDNADFTPQQFVPQALTSTTPALAVNGNTLATAWKGNTTNDQLWYATANNPY